MGYWKYAPLDSTSEVHHDSKNRARNSGVLDSLFSYEGIAMDSELIQSVVLGAPNFIGFLLALLVLWRAFSQLMTLHREVLQSMIKRENCQDE